MSRALDRDVAASLSNGDSQAAYKAISEAIDPASSHELLDIEILKGAYHFEPGTHVLRDGAAIAISKSSLVQAYFVALEVLKKHLGTNARTRPSAHTCSADGHEPLLATSVILLMDPEHLTAANTRKRILRDWVRDWQEQGGIDSPPGWLEAHVLGEKRFIDSLLTSRLHRHTKSPTLWSHRRWLTLEFLDVFDLLDVEKDISKVVMIAAERHPRNYYAWHHARLLATLVDDGADKVFTAEVRDPEAVRQGLLRDVAEWCTRHHDDISGWSFLAHLLAKEGWYEPNTVSTLVGDLHKLTRSMRWTNESVWWFLRTVAASIYLEGGDEDFHETIAILIASAHTRVSRDGSGQRVLSAAAVWYAAHRKTTMQEAGS
jgi:protein prenyltransferase alpha subunit repeat containing protein 1